MDDVRRALVESGIEPSLLTLEITETMLMYDLEATRENLNLIKALGVRIAIDDFGTGYASLSQLRRLPVDILKIDRSFIAALDNGGWSRELLRASELLHAILGVSQALSLSVVAEGIEEENQLSRLGAMGCEMGQGFFLGRPSPPEDIRACSTPTPAGRPSGDPRDPGRRTAPAHAGPLAVADRELHRRAVSGGGREGDVRRHLVLAAGAVEGHRERHVPFARARACGSRGGARNADAHASGPGRPDAQDQMPVACACATAAAAGSR